MSLLEDNLQFITMGYLSIQTIPRAIFYTIIFVLSIASVVLFGLHSNPNCTTNQNEDCSTTMQQECSSLYSYQLRFTSEGSTMTYHCPWRSRDLGVGFTALALSIINVIYLSIGAILNIPWHRSPKIIKFRAFFGILVFIFLITICSITWKDIYEADIPENLTNIEYQVQYNRDAYKTNGILISLSVFFTLILTAYEIPISFFDGFELNIY